MKIIILLLLAAIIVSLSSGLFFLTKKGEKNSEKLLRSLKIRVGLSVTLIVFLVLAFFLGWIPTPEVAAPSDSAATTPAG